MLVSMRADDLKFTDEQLGKLQRLAGAHGKKHEEQMDAMMKAMEAMHKLMIDPAADDAAIKKAAQDHQKAFDAMVLGALDERAAVHAILKADQLKELKSMHLEAPCHRKNGPTGPDQEGL